MAASEATYVYGVLDAGAAPSEGTGIGGAPLRKVVSDGLAALVSPLPAREPRLGREDMTTHARVLEAALERGTVLPMRFGVVMEGEAAVRRDLLDAHVDERRRQLTELTGKVELRVRAVYKEDRLMREVVSEEPELARMRNVLRGLPDAAAHFDRIRLGEIVALAVERKREFDAEQILGALSPLALAVEASERAHERIVINASFLVDAERIAEFDKAVDELGREQAERMRFRYTGPLPPHSFVALAAEN